MKVTLTLTPLECEMILHSLGKHVLSFDFRVYEGPDQEKMFKEAAAKYNDLRKRIASERSRQIKAQKSGE